MIPQSFECIARQIRIPAITGRKYPSIAQQVERGKCISRILPFTFTSRGAGSMPARRTVYLSHDILPVRPRGSTQAPLVKSFHSNLSYSNRIQQHTNVHRPPKPHLRLPSSSHLLLPRSTSLPLLPHVLSLLASSTSARLYISPYPPCTVDGVATLEAPSNRARSAFLRAIKA